MNIDQLDRNENLRETFSTTKDLLLLDEYEKSSRNILLLIHRVTENL